MKQQGGVAAATSTGGSNASICEQHLATIVFLSITTQTLTQNYAAHVPNAYKQDQHASNIVQPQLHYEQNQHI